MGPEDRLPDDMPMPDVATAAAPMVSNFYNEELPMFSIDEMRRGIALDAALRTQPASAFYDSASRLVDDAKIIETYLRDGASAATE